MAVQSFAALRNCFATDLAALIGNQPQRGNTPNAFIDLVEEVRDVLGASSIGAWQDASEDLDHAAGYLTDALTGPDSDQRSLLAWARTRLRDGVATASCSPPRVERTLCRPGPAPVGAGAVAVAPQPRTTRGEMTSRLAYVEVDVPMRRTEPRPPCAGCTSVMDLHSDQFLVVTDTTTH